VTSRDPDVTAVIREHVRQQMIAKPPPPLSPEQVRLFRRLFVSAVRARAAA